MIHVSTPVRHVIVAAMDTGLGALIRQARLRRGWTQEQLADRIGVQKSYVSQWETGARKWPQEHVRAIASLLGLSQVRMAVAAGLIDDPETAAPPSPYSPEKEAVLAVLDDMSDEEARALADAGVILLRLRRAQTVAQRAVERVPALIG